MFNSSFIRRGIGVCFFPIALFPLIARAQESLDVERYVEIVRRSHPAGHQAKAHEAAALAERRGAGLFSDPIIEYSHSRASIEGLRATERGFAVTQVLPWPGWRSAEVRVSEKAGDGWRAAGQALLWDVEVEARHAFSRLVESYALVEIERSAEDDARSLRDVVGRRVDLGESRESDRLRANVQWMRQQTALDAAEREATAAERVVRALAVAPLPEPLILRSEAWTPPLLTESLTLKARLDRNPGLRSAQADAQREEALLSLALARRRPELELRLFRGQEFDKTSTGLSFGLRVPLWNANRGEIARAEAAAAVSNAIVARTRVEMETMLDALGKDLDVAGRQARTLYNDILPAATASLKLVRFSYEEGETSLLDLLDAQRTWRDTQREAIQARLSLARAIAEIQRLVGPDFNPWSVKR